MLVVFFVGVWTLIMYALHRATKTNSWAASIFAVGLGTPRWCQMLWSLSGESAPSKPGVAAKAVTGMGLYLPWLHRSGAPWLGGYFSIGLWLWLGTLDAVQGVGIGIMLLRLFRSLSLLEYKVLTSPTETLSRQHVGAAIAASQVVGVAVVMAAKRTWPFIASEVFPNFAFLGTDSPVGSPLASWPFCTLRSRWPLMSMLTSFKGPVWSCKPRRPSVSSSSIVTSCTYVRSCFLSPRSS